MKNIIFIAPPAAGKGTQAEMLKEKYNLVHISTGDLLRHEISSGSPMGNHIKELIEDGRLVEDNIIFDLLKKRLNESDCEHGYILDGFPRDIEQAKGYEEICESLNRSIGYVIFLDISKEEAMKRITGRISCPSCGAVYNEYIDSFEKKGFCNNCSAKLEKRSDDNEETFNHRFDTYITKTKPVVDYYKEKGLLHIIDSNGTKDQTFAQIENIITGE